MSTNGKKSLRHRSRITNGEGVVAQRQQAIDVGQIHERHDASHDQITLAVRKIATEPQRMISRHVAVLDTEALFLSDKIGAARNAGEEPAEKTIDLFNRVVANQRRLLEAIGMEPHATQPQPITR